MKVLIGILGASVLASILFAWASSPTGSFDDSDSAERAYARRNADAMDAMHEAKVKGDERAWLDAKARRDRVGEEWRKYILSNRWSEIIK